jgi:anion-transporting  ArsA/GET3 family ATPase
VVGGDVIADAIAFFQAFDGMETGFRERAERVIELLRAPSTAYVLVASPKRDTVEEASFFAAKLAESGLSVSALVVNRMHPGFGTGDSAQARAGAGGDPARAALWRNLADLRQVHEREAEQVAGLAEEVAPAPVVTVPLLHDDVHDLVGLEAVGAHLFGTGT